MHNPPRARPLSIAAGLAIAVSLAGGCSQPAPETTTATARATAATDHSAASQQATSRVGDVTIRASAIQTSALQPEVASRYGIERSDGTVMLLVAVRQGSQAQATSLPARISATATDLRGHVQPIAMRELRSGELLDYVGTVEVATPDTLRFEIDIVREGGAHSSMQFSRDFYPR